MFQSAMPSALPGQSWSSTPVGRVEAPQPSHHACASEPVSHTQQPIMTGTSVLGIKFDGGVLLAADTLASYGSLARFDDVSRLHAVGSHTCIAAGGDMSDFQHLKEMLDAKVRDEFVEADGHQLRTAHVYEWLSRLLYARRTKINPIWVSTLVGGWDKGAPFLAYVDLLGTTFSAPTLATGYGAHLAQPLMRKAVEGREGLISRQEAEELADRCMRVLFYRDARSINKYQIATITSAGVTISDARTCATEWYGFAEKIRGYGVSQQ